MMDPVVEIKCMKVDLDIVKECLSDATSQFTELIKKETKKDFSTKLVLNEKDFLDKDHKNALILK